LNKSPDDRWQSVRDVLHALALVDTAAPTLHNVSSASVRARVVRWVPVVLAFGLAIAAGAIALRRNQAEPAPLVQFSISPPPGTRFDWTFTPNSAPPAVSPDGRSIAFGAADVSATTTLWIRRLDGLELHQLPGTEGATGPFWSPDSQKIAFFSGNALKVVNITGGPVRTLCNAASARGGAWSRNNTIVFAEGTSGGLKRISADGGSVETVTALDSGEMAHRWPLFLPDGRHFIYSAGRFGPGVDMSRNTLYVGDSQTATRTPIEQVNSSAAYDARGFLLYVRDSTLMAVPFDAGAGKIGGGAQPIVEGVAKYNTSGRSMFSVSDNGLLAYHPATATSTELRWTDATGTPGALVDTLHSFVTYRISPDGKRIAVALPDARRGENDIWIYEAGARRKLTFDINPSTPLWSRDGSRVLFVVQRGDTATLYEKPADGSTPQREIGKIRAAVTLEDLSPDGRSLAFATFDLKTQYDLWTAALDALDQPRAIGTSANFTERQGRFSPDGRWLAYHSNETGRYEVYVQPLPPTGARWQVTTSGGAGPQWTADGKRLFFQTPDLFVTAVDVRAGAAFETGPPRKMFKLSEIPYPREGGAGFFEVGPGGSILWQSPITSGAAPLVILTDWMAAMKR
jgi:Tol biopolymer transport system component